MNGGSALLAFAIVGTIAAGTAQAQDAGAAIFHATTLNLSATGEVKAAPTPVEPGQLTIDVRLSALYELGQ
jgi:uncharacterized protein YggE